jgi:hypothetical protein
MLPFSFCFFIFFLLLYIIWTLVMSNRKFCGAFASHSRFQKKNNHFPTRVTRGFILNSRGIGLKAEFFFSTSSNLQIKVFALCPQLHCVVVKHKVPY